MSKRAWWKRIADDVRAWWDALNNPTPTPTPPPEPNPPAPGPVEPPPTPAVVSFPEALRRTEIHRTRDREWNISFHGAGVVGEYDNNSRHDARLVKLGTKSDLIAKNWETLNAPANGIHCAAEKGDYGAPTLFAGGAGLGRKPRNKISLTTAMLNGKSVTFSADQNDKAASDWEDSATGALLGTLSRTGAVIAAIPWRDGLLCALDGGKAMVCVSTAGEVYESAIRCFAQRDGATYGGGQDGWIHHFGSGTARVSLAPLDGRVMDLAADKDGRLWATTDKGSVWCMLSDGQVRRYLAGEVSYGSSSWFGPRFNYDWPSAGLQSVARKVRDGSSWRCIVERLEVIP